MTDGYEFSFPTMATHADPFYDKIYVIIVGQTLFMFHQIITYSVNGPKRNIKKL
jgi:hypothetical protein